MSFYWFYYVVFLGNILKISKKKNKPLTDFIKKTTALININQEIAFETLK